MSVYFSKRLGQESLYCLSYSQVHVHTQGFCGCSYSLKGGPETSEHTISKQWEIKENQNASQSASFMMDRKRISVGKSRVLVL